MGTSLKVNGGEAEEAKLYDQYHVSIDKKHQESGKEEVAIIFGATGLVGAELAKSLLHRGWRVYGVARRSPSHSHPQLQAAAYRFVGCDLLDPNDVDAKVGPLAGEVTHAFWVTWSSKHPFGTPESRDQNVAMLSNALDALLRTQHRRLRHVCLQTGLMHYVSASGGDRGRRFHEESSPRVADGGHSFYYALEDLLEQRLHRKDEEVIGWSVHRPGLLLGASRNTSYNFVGSLCVYGSVCKHLGLPFLFAGDRWCWEEEYMDVSDVGVVAEQEIWAATSATTATLRGEAFNAVSEKGPLVWKEMWPALAAKLGLDHSSGDGLSEGSHYWEMMGDKEGAWEEIVEKEGLQKTRIGDLANWYFLEGVFRCPKYMMASRGKAEKMGFVPPPPLAAASEVDNGNGALDCICYWVDELRRQRIIPSR